VPLARACRCASGGEHIGQSGRWVFATGFDRFGLNYPMRAMVAGSYLCGNGAAVGGAFDNYLA
jgi:hypothetical protein